ncbi:hypothetical protein DAMA08_015370 [Martiniozyma asiatica (nom. inval.)]|nr:hypothetical protein DAMA08_015370 [Martiniozyma asiatica]
MATSTYWYTLVTEPRKPTKTLNNDFNSLGKISKPQNKLPKRSLTGCLTCRARKRKCDEHHPICKECARLNIKCVYGENTKLENIEGLADNLNNSGKFWLLSNNESFVDGIGIVKVLRAKVEYKINNGEIIYKA